MMIEQALKDIIVRAIDDAGPPKPRFTLEEAWTAWDGKFNCGPASICAVMELTPEQLRPHMGDFERKGYTNPTLMWSVLRGLGVRFGVRTNLLGDRPCDWPKYGLARIQWAGPWTEPGIDIRARYRQTHWVGVARNVILFERPCEVAIFDVNAMSVGGWIRLQEWSGALVPYLLKEAYPRANGQWWPTHSVEVSR